MNSKTNIITTIILYGGLLTGLIIWSPWGENFEKVRLYHFYYLLFASIIWLLGFKFFGGRFIRPKWKIPGKFIGYLTISFVLLTLFDHYALIYIIGHQASGVIGHYFICKKHDIDFWTCEPESKYLEVTEKWTKGKLDK